MKQLCLHRFVRWQKRSFGVQGTLFSSYSPLGFCKRGLYDREFDIFGISWVHLAFCFDSVLWRFMGSYCLFVSLSLVTAAWKWRSQVHVGRQLQAAYSLPWRRQDHVRSLPERPPHIWCVGWGEISTQLCCVIKPKVMTLMLEVKWILWLLVAKVMPIVAKGNSARAHNQGVSSDQVTDSQCRDIPSYLRF